MRRPILLLALLFAAVLGAMAAKSWLIELPQRTAPAATGEFDEVAAKAQLAAILGDQRPHPADSEAGDQVRDRLIAALSGLGLTPIVRDQIACNELHKARGISCARVRNVIAVLGPPSGKAVLLNAHYDSTQMGPGAGDAGIGVATLLEVARNLKDAPLKRPVILLFNEGEELGLVGARAFLADPLSRNVDSLVNLEARGVRGPANMFETSQPSGPAIGVFRRAVARPVANSLSTDVYRLLPNYTDVNSFSERGWLTLNIAPIGNETRYHSAGDDLAALDPKTLRHMGDQTLALARELANGPAPRGGGERIFVDLAGRTLVALPMIVGMVLLLALLVGFGRLSRRSGGMAAGALVTVGTILGSAALSWLALTIIGMFRDGIFWRAQPHWTHLAVYASVIVVGVALLATIGRRRDASQIGAAFWFIYLLLGGLIALAAPGGIIFFLFPPLLAGAGLLAARWWKPAEIVGASAAVALLYLTWGELLALLEELLNQGPMWIFAILASLVILPLLILARPLIARASPAPVVALAAVPMVALWVTAALAPSTSGDRQQRFVVERVTAGDKGYWSVLNDRSPLPESYRELAEWRWAKLPHIDRLRWLADAPPVEGMVAPTAEVVSNVRSAGRRTVTLRLRPNGAERVAIVGAKDARIISAGVAGFVRPMDPQGDGKYQLACSGRSCEGLVMQFTTSVPVRMGFTIVGTRAGLPAEDAPLLARRPKFARPQYTPDQTVTISRLWL